MVFILDCERCGNRAVGVFKLSNCLERKCIFTISNSRDRSLSRCCWKHSSCLYIENMIIKHSITGLAHLRSIEVKLVSSDVVRRVLLRLTPADSDLRLPAL